MANRESTTDALLEAIEAKLSEGGLQALQILWLAEAFAWVMNPNQSHGGTAQSRN